VVEMFNVSMYRRIGFLVTALGLLTSAAFAADTINVTWNDQALAAVRATRMGPPMVARSMAVLHTCIFDAWAAYDRTAVGTRFGGSLRRPPAERTTAAKQKAISYAAYRALTDLFPQSGQVAAFNAQMAALGFDPADTSTDTTTPQGIGNVACAALLAFRHHDGSNQLADEPGSPSGAAPYADYTGFVPVNSWDTVTDPNRWQPLRVPTTTPGVYTIQKYLAPQWGLVTPFALSSPLQFLDSAPALYGSKAYRRQAEQVLAYSAGLTDFQKVVAEYWADGPASETPPGHWTLFAEFVSRRDHHNVDADTKMFFLLGNGLLDASIAAWSGKRAFGSERPITAIHVLFAGQPVRAWAGPYGGTQTIDGADWQPYQASTVVTPPFPEFFSGHSVFSRTAATILTLFTGSREFGASYTQHARTSAVEPGMTPAADVTLSWRTFQDAADQAGLSRRYGGIHFEDGDMTGRRTGAKIGRLVWLKAVGYFDPAKAETCCLEEDVVDW
jgi:hypothetical protein